MRYKIKKKTTGFIFGALILLPTLCSAGYDDSYLLSYYAASVGTSKTTYGRNQKGEPCVVNQEERIDAGYSSVGIGQLFGWTVTSYQEFDASANGYIIAFDTPFLNPKTISNYSLSVSLASSSTCTFSYASSETISSSNRLSVGMNLPNFGTIESSTDRTLSFSTTHGYSYTFGQAKTIQRTYTFDFSKVPAGYVVAPCLVCSAKALAYTYTYYDHWWWGDYPVRTEDLVNVKNNLLIYDPDTFFVTLAIKKPNEIEPVLYLKP